ncbi:MAG: hypothetical protein ABIK10_02365 [candidate division WOR-3 bacterium]
MNTKSYVYLVYILIIVNIGLGLGYQMPYSARSIGLAEANVSFLGDIGAIAYNPAVLMENMIGFNLTEWFIDSRIGSVIGSYNVKDKFLIGGAFSYLYYGVMPIYNELGTNEGQMSADLYSYQLAIKKGFFNSKLSCGASIKGLVERIAQNKTQALYPQVGIIYTTKIFHFGGSVAITSHPISQVGLTAKLPYRFILLAATSYQAKLDFRLGLESQVNKLAFRAGWSPKALSLGIGYTEGNYQFDYAIRNYKELGPVHSFSLTIR